MSAFFNGYETKTSVLFVMYLLENPFIVLKENIETVRNLDK